MNKLKKLEEIKLWTDHFDQCLKKKYDYLDRNELKKLVKYLYFLLNKVKRLESKIKRE